MNHEVLAIIDRADEVLRTAYAGLEMMRSPSGASKNLGLRNVLTFSRSVTFVIQNIRGKDDRFEDWYHPHQEKMKADPIFCFFRDARNNLEKQGRLEVSMSARIKYGPAAKRSLDALKPPGAIDFFIGDHLGGSGWTVQLPNGELLKYYIEIPSEVAHVEQHFSGDLSSRFLLESKNSTFEHAIYILDELSKLLDEARKFFLKGVPNQRINGKPLPSHIRIVK